jgi:hypothetical protein
MKNIQVEDAKHKQIKMLSIQEGKTLEKKTDEILAEYFEIKGIDFKNFFEVDEQ